MGWGTQRKQKGGKRHKKVRKLGLREEEEGERQIY